jgi:hypothetical protein
MGSRDVVGAGKWEHSPTSSHAANSAARGPGPGVRDAPQKREARPTPIRHAGTLPRSTPRGAGDQFQGTSWDFVYTKAGNTTPAAAFLNQLALDAFTSGNHEVAPCASAGAGWGRLRGRAAGRACTGEGS